MFLKAERRQLRREQDRHLFQIHRVALQMRQEKRLGKIDDDEIAVCGMRNHMHAVRQDERQGVAREWPLDAADVLHGVATEVDLDLEVLVPVRRGFGATTLFVANVEIGQFAALLHDVSRDTAG